MLVVLLCCFSGRNLGRRNPITNITGEVAEGYPCYPVLKSSSGALENCGTLYLETVLTKYAITRLYFMVMTIQLVEPNFGPTSFK